MGVLLACHGQGPEALRGVRWAEWYASVDAAWQELRSRCERVVALGFSMGGLQALHLAPHRPLDGIITLAAALHIAGGWQLRTLPVARYFIPWYYPFQAVDFRDPVVRASISEKMGAIDLDDPATLAQLRTSIRISTGAIYEVVRLAAQVRRELARIRAPALVLQGRLDEMVLPVNAERIYAGLGSHDKKVVWFQRSGHQLPSDVEHRDVSQTIVDWLSERLPADTRRLTGSATTGQ
jgi:carboxylesterase